MIRNYPIEPVANGWPLLHHTILRVRGAPACADIRREVFKNQAEQLQPPNRTIRLMFPGSFVRLQRLSSVPLGCLAQ